MILASNQKYTSYCSCCQHHHDREYKIHIVSGLCARSACRFKGVCENQLLLRFYLSLQITVAAVLYSDRNGLFTGIVLDFLLLVIDFGNRVLIRTCLIEFESFEGDRSCLVVLGFVDDLAGFIFQLEGELTVLEVFACQAFYRTDGGRRTLSFILVILLPSIGANSLSI